MTTGDQPSQGISTESRSRSHNKPAIDLVDQGRGHWNHLALIGRGTIHSMRVVKSGGRIAARSIRAESNLPRRTNFWHRQKENRQLAKVALLAGRGSATQIRGVSMTKRGMARAKREGLARLAAQIG